MLQALMYGDEGDLWQQTAAECIDDMFKLFDDAVAQEKNWANYLFKDGSVIGLNSEILCSYVEYIANVRIKALGFDRRYPTTQDPLPWMQSYLVSDNVQVAPQESEITSYVSGAIDMNVGDDTFSGFSL